MSLFTKIFGTASQRELKSIYPIVDKIEALEEEYKGLTDAQLQAKTPEFKERLANGETLDDILPEAIATCREAAWRVLGMRPYRVQLVGGVVPLEAAGLTAASLWAANGSTPPQASPTIWSIRCSICPTATMR